MNLVNPTPLITPQELEAMVKTGLDDFYKRRIERIKNINLKELLRRKNPYLFRAIGTETATELVAGILQARISSSDETIFGDAFFEPLVRECAKRRGGSTSLGRGTDIVIETNTTYTVIEVKSGPGFPNASGGSQLDADFKEIQRRLQKIHKQFDPVLAHCYGRKSSSSSQSGKHMYRVISGQEFWREVTGDEDFYLKLIHLMKNHPAEHRLEFEQEWNKTSNRFMLEFLTDFSIPDGSIDWDKLLRFNSGAASAHTTKRQNHE